MLVSQNVKTGFNYGYTSGTVAKDLECKVNKDLKNKFKFNLTSDNKSLNCVA